MDKLQVCAKFPNVAPDKLDGFKNVVAQLVERAKGEADTLEYDFFLSADQTVCIVREAYANSEAVMAHSANMGDLLPRLFELGGSFEAEVFGNPSPALLEALAAFNPTIYSYLQGK
jgi:quinol monooxygenase YgiN